MSTVALFARAPVLGEVKTRLAAGIGAEAALAAHEALVEAALAQLSGSAGFALTLWIAGDVRHPQVCQWAAQHSVTVHEQQGADLGARMDFACQRLLQTPVSRVLVIGCDCPTIDERYVLTALAALADNDLVLGPAEDGGYGLIGLRKPRPLLFDGIPWSTPDVLQRTLQAAERQSLSWQLLDTIWDVDTADDWARYQALRNRNPPS